MQSEQTSYNFNANLANSSGLRMSEQVAIFNGAQESVSLPPVNGRFENIFSNEAQSNNLPTTTFQPIEEILVTNEAQEEL